jgi:hypothetical protein
MSCSLVQRYRFGKNLPRLHSTRKMETSGPSETFVPIYRSRLITVRSVVLWHCNISMYIAVRYNKRLLNSSVIATLWVKHVAFTDEFIKSLLRFKAFFFHGPTAPRTPGPPQRRSFTITDTPPSVDLYLTTQNIHTIQTSMPSAGFEPTFPAN